MAAGYCSTGEPAVGASHATPKARCARGVPHCGCGREKFGPVAPPEPTRRCGFQAGLNAGNVQNRSQMDYPVTDPYSTNFGRIVNQTAATNRWLQVQARLTF